MEIMTKRSHVGELDQIDNIFLGEVEFGTHDLPILDLIGIICMVKDWGSGNY